MNPDKLFPHNENAPRLVDFSQEVEGFYLTRDVVMKNSGPLAVFFQNNREDVEGRDSWYTKLLTEGVSLDLQERAKSLEPQSKNNVPSLDPERVLQQAGKISEFFLKNLDAQAAFFAANNMFDSEQ